MKQSQDREMQVLLVEDDVGDIDLTLSAFQRSHTNSKVHTVTTSEEAIDFIYHKGSFSDAEKFPTPDLIMLDINLPGKSGLSLLEDIKSDPLFDHIPIIILSGCESEKALLKGFSYGIFHYLQKSIDFQELTESIKILRTYWDNIIEQQKAIEQKQKKVLLIDDDEEVNQFMSEVLLEEGYQVHNAFNGQEGFAMAKLICPDLIIVDLKMPIRDGFELIQMIRADVSLKEIPLFVMTANSGVVDSFLDEGIQGYLIKPLSQEEVFEKISCYLK